jgi:hypothetical protein
MAISLHTNEFHICTLSYVYFLISNAEGILWIIVCNKFHYTGGHDGTVGWGTSLQARNVQVKFPMVSSEFFQPHYGPGVKSAFSRGMLPGGKGSWCTGLRTMPPSFVDCPEIPGASTSWKPQGLYRDCFTLHLDLGLTYSHLRHKCLAHQTEIVNIHTTNWHYCYQWILWVLILSHRSFMHTMISKSPRLGPWRTRCLFLPTLRTNSKHHWQMWFKLFWFLSVRQGLNHSAPVPWIP